MDLANISCCSSQQCITKTFPTPRRQWFLHWLIKGWWFLGPHYNHQGQGQGQGDSQGWNGELIQTNHLNIPQTEKAMILARLGSSGELILISSGLLWHLACLKIERRKTHNARPSACVGASLCTLPCCSSQPPPPPRLPLGRPWIRLRVSLDHPSALPLWAADGIGRCWWEHSLGEPGTDLTIWTS